MLGKIKMLLDAFGKITTGVLIATAIFITAFWGWNCEIDICILWQILAVSAFCSMGILIFPSGFKKEISKKGMLIRKTVYFLYVNSIVLSMGKWFGWFSFQSWKMLLFMEILIIGVFVLINLISYLGDSAVAKTMNDKLAERFEK